MSVQLVSRLPGEGRSVRPVEAVAGERVAEGREVDPEDWEKVVPEGVEAMVPARGPATGENHSGSAA